MRLNHHAMFLLAVSGLALLGLLIQESYLLHIMILCFIWCGVVAGWDLVMGYAGTFNFAQLAFFAVGAYASAMLAIELGVSAPLAIFGGGAAVGLFRLLEALPCLRLRGEYVALFTFAVHLALPTIIEQGRDFGTGGSTGLIGIPPIELFGRVMTATDKTGWYFLSLFVAALSVWLVYFVVLSGRWGRAFVALRDSEDFALAIGISDVRYKSLVFVLSAFVTGISGALYAHYLGLVTPKILGNEFFLMVMVMLSVGGLGRFPGAILGAFVITIGNELLRETGEYRLLVLGLAVMGAILFLPGGLGQLAARLRGTEGDRPEAIR
ncbi:MAG: branched-chain amino acid ABC transporter permease [Geminicoccaceae bacterium]